MKNYYALFLLEMKRFYRKKHLIVLVLLLGALLFVVNNGIVDYRQTLDKSEKFREIERLMFAGMLNYTHYSFTGVRYLDVPGAASIFFAPPPNVSELSAKIDSISSVQIYNNCRGSSFFKSVNNIFQRFHGLLFYLGSLFVLFMGYDASRHHEYSKSLAASYSGFKLFIYILLCRFLFITVTLVFLSLSLLAFAVIRGMEFTAADIHGLAAYLVSLLLTFLACLAAGGVTGTFRAKKTGGAKVLALWFVLFFIIPGLVDLRVEDRAKKILTGYKTDLDKLQIVNEFERNTFEKEGKFSRERLEVFKKLAEEYWREDYPRIAAEEEKLKNEIKGVIAEYRFLSFLFPSTFSNYTANEASSQGYENFLDFYNYAVAGQEKFARFFIDRVFYHDPNELKSFISGDENIFRSVSRIPADFLAGIPVQLSWIAALLFWGVLRSQKRLYLLSDKKPFIALEKDIELTSNAFNPVYTKRSDVKDHLYRLFTGKSTPPGPGTETAAGKPKQSAANTYPTLTVTIDGEPVITPGFKAKPFKNFVYLCSPAEIPGDIEPLWWISYICRCNQVSTEEKECIIHSLNEKILNGRPFSKLSPAEQAEVFYSVVHVMAGDLFLVDQAGRDMPNAITVKLVLQMEKLVEKGATVIYITPEKRVVMPKPESERERELFLLTTWTDHVKAHRFLVEDEEEVL
jgi:hypothetical protein